jgi:hypothetical protein
MLLIEQISDFKSHKSGKQLYVEGIAIQSGIVNKNRRYYDPDITARECQRYVREQVVEKRAYGCLGHGDHPQTDPERISHRIVSLTQHGNDWRMKAVIIPEGLGKVAAGILETGGLLGASSRAVATVHEREDGVKVVNEDFHLISAADLVLSPSAPDAIVKAIYEGVFDKDDFLVEAANEIRRLLDRKKISEIDVYARFITQVSRANH